MTKEDVRRTLALYEKWMLGEGKKYSTERFSHSYGMFQRLCDEDDTLIQRLEAEHD